jgi:hypothetical protein
VVVESGFLAMGTAEHPYTIAFFPIEKSTLAAELYRLAHGGWQASY